MELIYKINTGKVKIYKDCFSVFNDEDMKRLKHLEKDNIALFYALKNNIIKNTFGGFKDLEFNEQVNLNIILHNGFKILNINKKVRGCFITYVIQIDKGDLSHQLTKEYFNKYTEQKKGKTMEKLTKKEFMKDFRQLKKYSKITNKLNLLYLDKDYILSGDHEIQIKMSYQNDIKTNYILKFDAIEQILKLIDNDDIICFYNIDNDLYLNKHILTKQMHEIDNNVFKILNMDNNYNNVTLKNDDLYKKINYLDDTIAINNPKFELNGALLDINNKALISTQTKALTVVKIDNITIDNNIIIDKDIMIPKLFFKYFKDYKKLIELNLKINNDFIECTNNNITITCGLINGKYPDYKRIIPKDINRYSFDFNFEMPFKNNISLEFKKNKLYITDLKNDIEIEKDYKLNFNTKFGFNGKDIIIFNKFSNNIKCCISSYKMPLLLTNDVQDIRVLMPVWDSEMGFYNPYDIKPEPTPEPTPEPAAIEPEQKKDNNMNKNLKELFNIKKEAKQWKKENNPDRKGFTVDYYKLRDIKVNLSRYLRQNGWEILDYKKDESDSQVDYFSPASWGGIAKKEGYTLKVDTIDNPKNKKWHLENKEGAIILAGNGLGKLETIGYNKKAYKKHIWDVEYNYNQETYEDYILNCFKSKYEHYESIRYMNNFINNLDDAIKNKKQKIETYTKEIKKELYSFKKTNIVPTSETLKIGDIVTGNGIKKTMIMGGDYGNAEYINKNNYFIIEDIKEDMILGFFATRKTVYNRFTYNIKKRKGTKKRFFNINNLKNLLKAELITDIKTETIQKTRTIKEKSISTPVKAPTPEPKTIEHFFYIIFYFIFEIVNIQKDIIKKYEFMSDDDLKDIDYEIVGNIFKNRYDKICEMLNFREKIGDGDNIVKFKLLRLKSSIYKGYVYTEIKLFMFGVKDTLKPLEEYVKEIKESEEYKKLVQRDPTRVIPELTEQNVCFVSTMIRNYISDKSVPAETVYEILKFIDPKLNALDYNDRKVIEKDIIKIFNNIINKDKDPISEPKIIENSPLTLKTKDNNNIKLLA